VIKNLTIAMTGNSKFNENDLMSFFEMQATLNSYYLLYVMQSADKLNPIVDVTEFFKKNDTSISMLEREGAIKLVVGTGMMPGRIKLELCWLELTKYGFDFVSACEGSNNSKKAV
jgi:hypothetical protein